MMRRAKTAVKGIFKILLVLVIILVLFILIAALLIFNDMKAREAEKKKNYIPMLSTTELPEVIEVNENHEYRRRLVSNWRIFEVQSGLATIEDINEDHPQRIVGADENMGVVDLDGNVILPPEYRSAVFTKAGYLKTWDKGGGSFTYYDLDGKVLETSYNGFLDRYENIESAESQFEIKGDYDNIQYYCYSDKTALVQKGDKLIWVNETGQEIAEITGEIHSGCYKVNADDGMASVHGGNCYFYGGSWWIELPIFHNGYCSVPHESKCGLIDANGNVVADYGYDEIMYLNDGLWFLVKGDEHYTYDTALGGKPMKFELPEGTIKFFDGGFIVENGGVYVVYVLTEKNSISDKS